MVTDYNALAQQPNTVAVPREQLESAKGYPYTHYDCPYCGTPLEFEGDTQGEVLECDHCRREFEG